MGSSTSKPRKGHKNPQHLPKVGTPANKAWEHEGRQEQVFGTHGKLISIVIAVALVLTIFSLIVLTA